MVPEFNFDTVLDIETSFRKGKFNFSTIRLIPISEAAFERIKILLSIELILINQFETINVDLTIDINLSFNLSHKFSFT